MVVLITKSTISHSKKILTQHKVLLLNNNKMDIIDTIASVVYALFIFSIMKSPLSPEFLLHGVVSIVNPVPTTNTSFLLC
jgi:hypothetical protein